MPEQFFTGLPYFLFATGVGLLGSVIALFWSPGANIRSAVQHFAAGAVLAAMAASVIPEVEHMGTFVGILGGFIAGGLVMMGTLMVVALALELLFLTVSVGLELRENKVKAWQSLAVTGGIASMFLGGALVQFFSIRCIQRHAGSRTFLRRSFTDLLDCRGTPGGNN